MTEQPMTNMRDDKLKPCPNPRCVALGDKSKSVIVYEGDSRCAPFVRCGNNQICRINVGSVEEWNSWPRATDTQVSKLVEAASKLRFLVELERNTIGCESVMININLLRNVVAALDGIVSKAGE